VEEAVMWFSGGHAAWWQVFLIALPAASAMAFLSWHLVERPMLRFKPGSRRGAARYAPAAQQA
jgi:peptidoglycan/LPS O-acetylase OafA/YrhL